MLNTANNAIWIILWTLLASSNTLTIKDNKWWLFPSVFPYRLTLIKFDPTITTKVIQREIIEVTNRVWNTFTITRAIEKVPNSDDAIISLATAFQFDDWDVVLLSTTKDFFDEIKTEISTLDSNKLNTSTYNQERALFASSSTWTDSYNISDSSVTSYIDWKLYKVKADVANTWSATLEVNTFWLKSLKKLKAWEFTDLNTWDIIINQIFWAIYNASEDVFQFSVDPATVVSPASADTQSTKTAWEDITAWNFLRKWIVANIPSLEITVFNNLDTNYNFWKSTTDSSSTQKVWQIFTALDQWLDYILIRIRQQGSPQDAIQVKIYESDKTTLVATANNTASWSILPWWSTFVDYKFEFNITNLIPTNTYFIEISRTWGLSNSNYYLIQWDQDNIYSWWNAFIDNWSWWITTGNFEEIWFKVQFLEVVNEDTTRLYKAQAIDLFRNKIIWVAKETIITWNPLKYSTSWVNSDQTWLSEGIYYLSDTSWNISTTPWTYKTKAWISVSSTEIKIETQDNLKVYSEVTSQGIGVSVTKTIYCWFRPRMVKIDSMWKTGISNSDHCSWSAYFDWDWSKLNESSITLTVWPNVNSQVSINSTRIIQCASFNWNLTANDDSLDINFSNAWVQWSLNMNIIIIW